MIYYSRGKCLKDIYNIHMIYYSLGKVYKRHIKQVVLYQLDK